jgi:hypothetical protein
VFHASSQSARVRGPTRVGRAVHEGAALDDGEKTRVLSERIPFGIDDQQGEVNVATGDSLLSDDREFDNRTSLIAWSPKSWRIGQP